jgi:protein phosphatase PTC1
MFRPYMEDTFSAEDNFGGDSTCGLFAVYDGHGGKTVSEYLSTRIPEEFKKRLVASKPTDLC